MINLAPGTWLRFTGAADTLYATRIVDRDDPIALVGSGERCLCIAVVRDEVEEGCLTWILIMRRGGAVGWAIRTRDWRPAER